MTTFFPLNRSLIFNPAARGTAPAPSAKLWVVSSKSRMLDFISSSETVTISDIPLRIISKVVSKGTRVARPSAKVSGRCWPGPSWTLPVMPPPSTSPAEPSCAARCSSPGSRGANRGGGTRCMIGGGVPVNMLCPFTQAQPPEDYSRSGSRYPIPGTELWWVGRFRRRCGPCGHWRRCRRNKGRLYGWRNHWRLCDADHIYLRGPVLQLAPSQRRTSTINSRSG